MRLTWRSKIIIQNNTIYVNYIPRSNGGVRNTCRREAIITRSGDVSEIRWKRFAFFPPTRFILSIRDFSLRSCRRPTDRRRDRFARERYKGPENRPGPLLPEHTARLRYAQRFCRNVFFFLWRTCSTAFFQQSSDSATKRETTVRTARAARVTKTLGPTRMVARLVVFSRLSSKFCRVAECRTGNCVYFDNSVWKQFWFRDRVSH